MNGDSRLIWVTWRRIAAHADSLAALPREDERVNRHLRLSVREGGGIRPCRNYVNVWADRGLVAGALH